LVDKLLIAFNSSNNYNRYQNPLWDITSSSQFTFDGITRLKNCFSDGVLRIEKIFLQDVISIQRSDKVGRRKLGIIRWKPNDSNPKNNKKRKNTEVTNESSSITSTTKITDDQDNFVQPNVSDLEPSRKRQRRVTKPFEQQLLQPLINSTEPPTDEQITKVIENLGVEWNKLRVSQYIFRHRNKK